MEVKIVFDRESLDAKFAAGWGVAYLIGEETLFDSSEKAEYLFNNLKAFNADISKIKRLIISHNHWDHLGGLWELLAASPGLEIFGGSDFSAEHKSRLSSNFKLVSVARQITENIYTSGCLEVIYKGSRLSEQAMLVRTEKGISIFCGCSHPGILTIVNRAKDIFPGEEIYAAIGGFHLMEQDCRVIRCLAEELQKAGVKKTGPAHCSGSEAENIFREVYAENFLDIKAGSIFFI